MKWTDIEIYKVRIVTRTMFYENDKYYPQVFIKWMPLSIIDAKETKI